MDAIDLGQELEQVGFELYRFSEDELQDLPFSEDDMLLFTECGLPTSAAPGKILFAQGVAPASGPVLRRLNEEIAQFQAMNMAKMIWVFARTPDGSVFWIHTMSGHQVTMKDETHQTNRYVNDSLGSFLQSIVLYRQFQLKYADGDAEDAAKVCAAAGPEAVAALKTHLEAIDAEAFSDDDNFWKFALQNN